jgi:hypothetical protein
MKRKMITALSAVPQAVMLSSNVMAAHSPQPEHHFCLLFCQFFTMSQDTSNGVFSQ